MIAVPFGGSIFPSKRDFWIVALIWLGAGMAIFRNGAGVSLLSYLQLCLRAQ
jgi:hypothetical protein